MLSKGLNCLRLIGACLFAGLEPVTGALEWSTGVEYWSGLLEWPLSGVYKLMYVHMNSKAVLFGMHEDS